MLKRSFNSHGQFFWPYLSVGLSVLDVGCGPGSMTLGIAPRVQPGRVVGVDLDRSQIGRARASLSRLRLRNLSFKFASCYELPFQTSSFDRVFSHALFEHLADPMRALKEMQRVLKPGGVVGICSPDWGGFFLSPRSEDLTRAIAVYVNLQNGNGGDVAVGRKLGGYLAAAGFEGLKLSARYECYTSLELIGAYLAQQLEREGKTEAAGTFRAWSHSPEGLFAQAWMSAVGRKPQERRGRPRLVGK